MLEMGIYPLEENQDVSQYWNHLASRVGWASEHVRMHGPHFRPLWIWGDDAQYNEANDKIVTVSMGAVLDSRCDAISTVWPLFSYRVETRMHYWCQLS